MDLHEDLSRKVGSLLFAQQQILVTAESCTGGAVATAITAIDGSSSWFERAFVTYSNTSKMEMLGVCADTLDQAGAVSEATVLEMVDGALKQSHASIAIAISGIAGPGGGSVDKPVGTVCFAWQDKRGWKKVETAYFSGDRTQVRTQAVYYALQTLHDYLMERAKRKET
jgi:nicotinamide-nucleotide amidase